MDAVRRPLQHRHQAAPRHRFNRLAVPARAGKRHAGQIGERRDDVGDMRSEEHTSELQSLMRTSYAVFCLKKKTKTIRSHSRVIHLLSLTTGTGVEHTTQQFPKP